MPVNLVRKIRMDRGISKKSLSSDVDCKISRITAIENGAAATVDEYAILALSLDTPIDELYPEQEKDWPEIEKKRQMILIRRQIDLEELEKQAEEKERLDDEILRKRSEREKLDNNLTRISQEHEAKLKEHEELTDQTTKNRILRELNFPPVSYTHLTLPTKA